MTVALGESTAPSIGRGLRRRPGRCSSPASSLRTGSRRHRISTVFQIPGRRADSLRIGLYTNFLDTTCTAIVALARPVLDRVPAVWGITICLILFACTWSIPKAVYPIPYLAWLGFPDPDFVSGDYYPLIPFYFMYLAGFFAARTAQESNCEAPVWAYENPIPVLASLGRHALPFYLLHQPVILGVLELIYSVR